ncbi:MAG: hypothetical protein ACI83I_000427 [Bacteroidia bacterium]|jgi:hypothetical protein
MNDYIDAITAKKLSNKFAEGAATAETDLYTTEIKYPFVWMYKGLKISEYANNTFIRGSIHKAYYNGINHNDFRFLDIVNLMDQLTIQLEVNPYDVRQRNIEFAVNILLPENIPVDKFIRHLYSHKGTPFNRMDTRHGVGIVARHTQYKVKIYDKRSQMLNKFPLIGNLCRIEIHVNKMEFIKETGIRNFADLLNPKKMYSLKTILLNALDQTIFLDWTVSTKTMNKPSKSLFKRWQNANYVLELSEGSKFKFGNEKKRFDKIQEQHSESQIMKTVKNLVSSKWDELSKLDLKTYLKLTAILSKYRQFDLLSFDRSVIELIPYKFINIDLVQYLRKKDLKKEVKKDGYCSVTGLPILHQKEGSKFQSAKYIGYDEAHRLRNLDSNERNRLRYKVERYLYRVELFPLNETLHLSTEQIKELEYWRGTEFDVLRHLQLKTMVNNGI